MRSMRKKLLATVLLFPLITAPPLSAEYELARTVNDLTHFEQIAL